MSFWVLYNHQKWLAAGIGQAGIHFPEDPLIYWWERCGDIRRAITCAFVPVDKTVLELILLQNVMDLLWEKERKDIL